MNCQYCTSPSFAMMNRRGFLSGCVGCAAAAVTGGGLLTRSSHAATARGKTKARVRVVFSEFPSDQPTWPNVGYDYEARRAELMGALTEGCPDVQFIPEVVINREQTAEVLARADDVDGYLVYTLALSWQGNPQTICAAGKPALLVDDLYGGSGEFLTQLPALCREKKPVEWVSSSRMDDVIESARCFALLKQEGKTADDFIAACRAIRHGNTSKPKDMAVKEDAVQTADIEEALKRLGETKILVIGGGWGGDAYRASVKELLGVEFVPIAFPEMHQAHQKADRGEAKAFADRWIKQAREVVEPDRAEIENAGALYVAMKQLMDKHDARGISINCLGGFYGGHLTAYPCLGFCQFNNDGLVGGCEADQRSALTMMVGSVLFGRPGYISDPVIDTSKYEIIYAHCVAPTHVFGPDGPANPYRIRNHSEDRKGASIQSLMPAGYMTTTIEIDAPSKTMLMHQARAAENIDNDKACRTKLAGELVGDMEKLVTNWSMGWHRVTFYGDLRRPLIAFADRVGLKVIEEA